MCHGPCSSAKNACSIESGSLELQVEFMCYEKPDIQTKNSGSNA